MLNQYHHQQSQGLSLDAIVHLVVTDLDFSDAKNLALVSKAYSELFNNELFWQGNIQKYFPILEEMRLEDFKKQPKKLFCFGYLSYFSEKYTYDQNPNDKIPINEWLNALSGKLDDILILDKKKKKYELLTEAVLNGNLTAITEMKKISSKELFRLDATFRDVKSFLLSKLIERGSKNCVIKMTKELSLSSHDIVGCLHDIVQRESTGVSLKSFFTRSSQDQAKLLIEVYKSDLTPADFEYKSHMPTVQKILEKYRIAFYEGHGLQEEMPKKALNDKKMPSLRFDSSENSENSENSESSDSDDKHHKHKHKHKHHRNQKPHRP